MKSTLYKKVYDRQIVTLEEMYHSLHPLLEAKTVDLLNLKIMSYDVSVRRVFRTVDSGRRSQISLHTLIVGDSFIGFGSGSATSFVEAKKISVSNAKLSIVPIRFMHHLNKHTIYKTVSAKSGSTEVKIEPVIQGSGLVCPPYVQEILQNIPKLELRILSKGSKNPINFYYALYKTFKNLWHIH